MICAESQLKLSILTFFFGCSDEGDEIVECDNCGITVHEGMKLLIGYTVVLYAQHTIKFKLQFKLRPYLDDINLSLRQYHELK